MEPGLAVGTVIVFALALAAIAGLAAARFLTRAAETEAPKRSEAPETVNGMRGR